MEPPKTIATKLLFQSSKLSLVEEELQRDNGSIYKHLTLQHPGAVVIVPVEKGGNILLLQQYRHSLRKTILELPAGTLNSNEEPETCAKRELEEETGMIAACWKNLGTLYPAPGFCNEKQFLCLASDLGHGKTNLDPDEIITVVRMKISEVEKAIADGTMQDAKSIAAFCRARLLAYF